MYVVIALTTALLVLAGCVARYKAWKRYMDVIQFAVERTGDADAVRHAAAVAEAMKGWVAAPALIRLPGNAVAVPARAAARAVSRRRGHPAGAGVEGSPAGSP
ncbi:hypothetical protein FraEuI1c_1287 [Pseudofrankia inefficax]|uniref:Uncharacterized protein n=1 Tax=Pseudofrankia inefficax (strain DSM 45817 / CECT 9037 / DDB 130130 / EuI1c) TaxID=298654 RepID=E3J3M2_PSEI1|nr:hypothetical protein FraEuI1c_1287 [Pseudofrankia inefficax]